ncbi:MAG: hypothetical protein ACW97Z_03850 [Candidatus Hodarchaeales archaeon]|jgi:hypothetical protein
MLVRLNNFSRKPIFILGIIVLSVSLVSFSVEKEFVTYSKPEHIINNKIAAGANFRIDISNPKFYIEYWETVNITVEITELSNQAWTNISTTLEWGEEGKLFLASGENNTHLLGPLAPLETVKTNYTITASPSKLDDPLVIGYIYLYQDVSEQTVESYSWYEGEYTSWGEANYGLFGISIQYPLLDLEGPLELGGVIPTLELAFEENTTLTYKLTNSGDSNLKNLSFHLSFETDLIEIISTPFTSLDTLSNKSSILYEIKIQCKATEETSTVLYFNISTDILGVYESSVQIEIVSEHLAINYDNRFVFYSWPFFIVAFALIALRIAIFSISKRAKTNRIAKELEEKYGKSYID